MSDQIFRKKSLDRISSPEQLNDYIRVANPGIWMILAAVIILLAGVCVWGIFGHLDTKTETVGTYLGFGGNDTPQYVIMVQVAAPGKNMEGGIHASPIFTDISNWMIDYQKIQPKG